MASTPADELLADYPVSEGCFDEAFAADGASARRPAPGWKRSCAPEPTALPGDVSRSLRRAGVRFSSVEGDLRVLRGPRAARDHRRRLGARQARPRAARARVERVRRGRVRRPADRRRGRRPARGVRSPPTTSSPRCAGCGCRATCGSASRGWTSCATPTASGSCWRTTCARPPGFAYLHATRRALLEHIDVPPDATPRPLDGEIDLLADTLRAVAPAARPRPPRAGRRRADRRRAQLRLLGARLALAAARDPAVRAARARGPRRRLPVAAPARAARGAPDRRRLPAHQRRPRGLRHRPAAARARPRAASSGWSTSTAPASPTTSSPTPTSRT